MLNLKKIEIDDKALFDSKINFSYENSESSFANLFMWRDVSDNKFTLIDDALCVFYRKWNGREACCFPLGKCDVKEVVLKIKKYFDEKNIPFIMESVAENEKNILMNEFEDQLIVTEDESLADYVYTSDKLISLSGKKLHAKRNHINKFKSLYNYEYVSLDKDLYAKCVGKAKEWLLRKYLPEDKDFASEMNALLQILSNYDKLKLKGGAILIDGNIAAFSLGEKLNDTTFVVHIEKADTDYEGSYTVINNEFASHECKDFEFVNREEDMGIEGIRKAKKSYIPDKMIKKYKIEFKEQNI